VKGHEFNYAKLLPQSLEQYTYIIYILIVIFIVTAVSNGANITDGLDGLATGVSAIIGICLGIFAYVSGNIKFAEYLNINCLGTLGLLVASKKKGLISFLKPIFEKLLYHKRYYSKDLLNQLLSEHGEDGL
jgi:phospho-N-acetylmuramoyl-pentapeptide-transferase